MIRSLWIAKTGMEAQQTQLDNISNNLANVGTNGYKRSHAIFEDLIYQNLRQSGASTTEQTVLPTGLQVGLGCARWPRRASTARATCSRPPTTWTWPSRARASSRSRCPTAPMPTRVTAPSSSTPTARSSPTTATPCCPASRSRAMRRASPSAATVLSPSRCQPGHAAANRADPAGQLRQSGRLDPRGQNLFTETASSGTPNAGAPNANGLGALQQGFVETNNVNVVEELVQMIQTQRAYELNSKAVQTSDQMLQKLAQI